MMHKNAFAISAIVTDFSSSNKHNITHRLKDLQLIENFHTKFCENMPKLSNSSSTYMVYIELALPQAVGTQYLYIKEKARSLPVTLISTTSSQCLVLRFSQVVMAMSAFLIRKLAISLFICFAYPL